MQVVLCTGGWDPVHVGHIELFSAARKLGDMLIVGANSDEWLERKKGRIFLPLEERMTILRALRDVDDVVSYNDSFGHSADAIRIVLEKYPEAKIIFANGGDRNKHNVPEQFFYKENRRVRFVFGVGGEKKNSSSDILKRWEGK